jgi:phosphatidylinositol glycan class W
MRNARRLSCNPPFRSFRGYACPPALSFFRRRQQALADKLTKRRISDAGLRLDKDLDLAGPRQTGKTPTELCSYSIVWWSLLGLTKLVNFQGRWVSEVSRRMVRVSCMVFITIQTDARLYQANLPYILWVAAFNTSFLLAYLVVLDILFFPGPKPKKEKKKSFESTSMSCLERPYVGLPREPPADAVVVEGNPPQLFEAINRHGLALFLMVRLPSPWSWDVHLTR